MTETVEQTHVMVEMETKTKVAVTLEVLADVFAHLSDDEQSRFFVAVAKRMASFGPSVIEGQGWYIGGHLRNCECSSEEAREFIRAIAYGLENSNHGRKAA